MEKIYTVENLDCANCAAKIERKINSLPEVEKAVLTFATKRLMVQASDPDALLPQLRQIVRSVEPEGELVADPREHSDHSTQTHREHAYSECHGSDCGCTHHDHHDHGDTGDHTHRHGLEEKWVLLIGAAIFGLSLLLLSPAPVVARILLVVAYLLLGGKVLLQAGKNLIRGHVFDENFLMSLATLGAFAIDEFPEAVGIMLFYRIGEYFEERAVAHSRSQIMEAVDLRPEKVHLLAVDAAVDIPAREANVGDLLLVKPGERIPLDAVITVGEGRVDTAAITGEPVPLTVKPGDTVLSGFVNTGTQLTVRVVKPLEDSMVSRILRAVENAAAGKPKIDRFITRFARIYTPVVVVAAVLTAVAPSLITGQWNYWIYTAISFLVMSCPCALVLSVPLAFFSGIGIGSRKGILFKGGLSIEAMAKIRMVALDKTGTLTKGEFSVQEIRGPKSLLGLCASLEQNSNHPIAVSITAAAKAQNVPLQTPEALTEMAGYGVCGIVAGKQVLCGNQALLEQFGIKAEYTDTDTGVVVFVAVDGKFAGTIHIRDSLKPDAAEAIAELERMGISVAMLTGDRSQNGHAIAETAGIGQVYCGLLPEDKVAVLQQLRQQRGAVMFVGDGINDAPVLAGADVGAAMGSGADAAIEAADVVFMTSSVAAIPESIRIAERTRRIAWQNVIFALSVKAVVVILGLMGYASMWLAVFADSGVAMLCVLNSIRMLYRKR